MITFLYGSAGSGKTSTVYSRILSDLRGGRQVLLLVPEQQAMSAERDVTETAQSSSPRCPTENLEVLNFTRLANRVFRQLGGLSYRVIDNRGKSLIMWQALNSVRPLLREYGESFSDPEGLIRLMLSAVKELKLYGILPEKLIEVSQTLEDGQKHFSDKLYDLALVYAAYEKLLREKYDDPLDDLPRLCALLRENPVLSGYSVYIDSFRGFTPQEYEVIGCLFRQAEQVTVTLGCLPGRKEPHFEALNETKKRLARLAVTHTDEVLPTVYRFSANPALGFLSENLWNYGADKTALSEYAEKVPEGVSIVRCGSRYAEAEEVCRRVSALVRETGCRYSDIAVIAHTADAYAGILDVTFEKYGIPYFMSRRTKLSEKPLIKLISSLFALKRFHLRADDMITCVKTGLTPLTADECDVFEGYIHTWNLCGSRFTSDDDWHMNPGGYLTSFTETQKNELKTVNESRRKLVPPITAFFESLGAGSTFESVSASLFRFLEEWKVTEKLSELDPEDAAAVWNEVMAILDQIVSVIGKEPADSETFARVFSMLVSLSDIGHMPASMDEVTVGSATMLRAGKPRHVFLLGVCEGEFPASVKENSVFSDNDKAELEKNDIILSPKTSALSAEELYIFWNSVSAPSETLTVLFHPSAEGEGGKPSSAVSRILSLFPLLRIVSAKEIPGEEKAQNYRASFELCTGDSPLSRSLRAIYSADPDYAARLDALSHPIVQTAEAVSLDTVKRLYPNGIALSNSRLEDYVNCAFGYYCKDVLKLEDRTRAQIRSNDTGSFLHYVLEAFVKAAVNENGMRSDLSDREIEDIVTKSISDYLDSLFGGEERIETRSSRILALFKRLKRFALLLVKNLIDEFSHSEFVPRFCELEIGDKPGSIPPLEIPLPDGTAARIFGKIDRVDTFRRGGKLYVRVADYKSGTKTFNAEDLALGLNMQMLLYLFSIWQNPTPGFLAKAGAEAGDEVVPAGVLYVNVKPNTLSLDKKTDPEEIEKKIDKKMTRSGLLLRDPEVILAMEDPLEKRFIPVDKSMKIAKDSELCTLQRFGELMRQINDTTAKIAGEIASGKADITPLTCKGACDYCRMRPVCKRTHTFRDAEEDDTEEKGEEA